MITLTEDQALAHATRHHALRHIGSSIEEVTTAIVGLHNTETVSPHLSLLARLPSFRRQELGELMWEEWGMARIRAMRLTMFIFPHDLMEIAVAATRHFAEPFATRWMRDSGLTVDEFERLAAEIETSLSDGPLTVRQIRNATGLPGDVDVPGIVSRMCDIGRLAGGAPPGDWRSPIRRYHLWDDVLPNVDLNRWDEDDAIRELIRRYVNAYGPVTIDDVSWWSGISKSRCRDAIDHLDLENVSVDGWAGPLLRFTDGFETELDPGVNILPLLDPYVQGYRDRDRFLDSALHDSVYDAGGNSSATIVENGRISGVWQFTKRPAEAVRYHLFAQRPASVRRAAEEELARAGNLYFEREVDVVEVKEMEPLSADGGRSAANPLP